MPVISIIQVKALRYSCKDRGKFKENPEESLLVMHMSIHKQISLFVT